MSQLMQQQMHAGGHAGGRKRPTSLGQPSSSDDIRRAGSVRVSGSAGVAFEGPKGQHNPDIPDYSRAFFYPDLPWGAPISAYPPVRLRGQGAMIVWECITLAMVLYVMVEVPYQMAFGIAVNGLPVCEWSGKVAFDIISCVVFLLDIVVQMHSASFVGNAQDGQWELIDRLSDIRKAYFTCVHPFKRSFFWDVLCCFPFIQVSCAIWTRSLEELAKGSGTYSSWKVGWEIVHWLSLFRVLKLYRLWKLSETAEKIQRASMAKANLLTLAKMIFYLFFVAHYLGCTWFAVGNVTPGSDTSMADFESSWTYLEGAIWIENDDGTFTRKIIAEPDGWLYEWLASIYWAVTTMTTIGYGDISAHNNSERIFCMFAMALGSSYFAWLAGTVTTTLARGSAGNDQFLDFLDQVRQFMDIKRYSNEVMEKVFVFYGLKYPTQLIFNDQEIMDSLPKGLRKRMQAENYMDIIETVPLFASLPESVKVEVCNAFETYYCSPSEILCAEDEEPDSLFVVRNGDVLLSCRGENVAICQRGQMFGELGMLGLTETGRRLRTAVSISECELLRMSKENFQALILSHGEVRVSYRKLVAKHLALLSQEATIHSSPIHDADKLVHVQSAWQTGKIPDKVRVPGKVAPPMMNSTEEKRVVTQVNLELCQLKGLPMIHLARGSVAMRFIIEYDVGVNKPEPKFLKYDTTVQQGAPVLLDFKGLLKFKHGLDPSEAVVLRPDIRIKVLYLRWYDHSPSSSSAVLAQLGYRGAQEPTGENGSHGYGEQVGTALPAPHVETVIANFQLSLKDIVAANGTGTRQQLEQGKSGVLSDTWTIGNKKGTLELMLHTRVSRELPPNSVIRSKFRSIWQNKRKLALHKKLGTTDDGSGFSNLDSFALQKFVNEVKSGVRNVLNKGDAGKTGAAASSFERVQEKAQEDTTKRLRDLKDQINKVMIYNQNFELHMNEEMHKTLVTLNQRIEDATGLQKQTFNHMQETHEVSSKQREELHDTHKEHTQKILVDSIDRVLDHTTSNIDRILDRIQEKETSILASQTRSYEAEGQILEMLASISGAVNGLKSRVETLEKADAERKESDQQILRMLEQIARRQGIAPPQMPAPVRAPVPMPAPAPVSKPPAARVIGSVGLMLGELREVGRRESGKAKIHLQVQGVLPGGSAEMSGMFRAGDEIMAVDGTPLDGFTLLEAKRLFLGQEGTMVQLSVSRPSTGKEFSLSLRRHVFTSDQGEDI